MHKCREKISISQQVSHCLNSLRHASSKSSSWIRSYPSPPIREKSKRDTIQKLKETSLKTFSSAWMIFYFKAWDRVFFLIPVILYMRKRPVLYADEKFFSYWCSLCPKTYVGLGSVFCPYDRCPQFQYNTWVRVRRFLLPKTRGCVLSDGYFLNAPFYGNWAEEKRAFYSGLSPLFWQLQSFAVSDTSVLAVRHKCLTNQH